MLVVINASVTVNGNLDHALKLLKRDTSGMFRMLKHRAVYTKPSVRRRLKSQRARSRAAKNAKREQARHVPKLCRSVVQQP